MKTIPALRHFYGRRSEYFPVPTWPAIHFFILTAGRKVMIGPVKAGELFLQNFD